MESIRQPNALILTGDLAEHWRQFKQEFKLYLIATGLDNKSVEQKIALLLYVAKSSAIEVYNTFTFDSTNEASSETFANVLDIFEKYCNPKKNITYERYIFFTRNQERSEPVESFVTDLMLKAKTCEFLTLRDSLIKDRIVLGIISQRVRERLLREDDLTLQKAMQICHAAEATERQLNQLDTEVTVNYCRGKGPHFVERKNSTTNISILKINKIKLQRDIVENVVGNMNQENVLLMGENVTSAVNLIILLDIVHITNNYTR